jgi:ribosomal protein S18 acetylase RimI-like enzyme
MAQRRSNRATSTSDRSLTVRRARASDRGQLKELVRAYIEFYREPQPSDERLDVLLALLVERPEIGVQFVAERGGQLLGFATVYLSYDTVSARRVATMNDLYVWPDDRDRGIGRALLERCHQFARANDCAVLQWITAADNERAQRLYDAVATRTTWVTYNLES